MKPGRHAILTDPIKRLLAFLREDGEVIERAGGWRSKWTGLSIHQGTVDAAYDRCLIFIVADAQHRKRHTAKLTEIGAHVASDLYRRELQGEMEAAQKLTTELVDAA